MTGLGSFQASIHGMKGQSHALATIGTNIVNATTTGYKRAETRFETLLGGIDPAGRVASGPSVAGVDFGGIGAFDIARIGEGGEIAATGGALDAAIDGRGLFSVSRDRGGAEPVLFTRDGSFASAVGGASTILDASGVGYAVEEGYLVDRTGHYLLGWGVADDGQPAVDGRPAGMRIDQGAFADAGRPTGLATLNANLPALAAVGSGPFYRLNVHDSAGGARGLDMHFGRTATPGVWSLRLSGDAGDVVDVVPPATAGGPGAAAELTFDPFGQLIGPGQYQVRVAHADAATTDFQLDLSALTQFAGDFLVRDDAQDGYGPGELDSVAFDQAGRVVGRFDNGVSRPLYYLAIADVINPDGLERRSGNLFAVTPQSGAASFATAGTGARGVLRPGTLERSNVSLEDEFSRMIQTQNAYNASATAFRTVDELLTTARDMAG